MSTTKREEPSTKDPTYTSAVKRPSVLMGAALAKKGRSPGCSYLQTTTPRLCGDDPELRTLDSWDIQRWEPSWLQRWPPHLRELAGRLAPFQETHRLAPIGPCLQAAGRSGTPQHTRGLALISKHCRRISEEIPIGRIGRLEEIPPSAVLEVLAGSCLTALPAEELHRALMPDPSEWDTVLGPGMHERSLRLQRLIPPERSEEASPLQARALAMMVRQELKDAWDAFKSREVSPTPQRRMLAPRSHPVDNFKNREAQNEAERQQEEAQPASNLAGHWAMPAGLTWSPAALEAAGRPDLRGWSPQELELGLRWDGWGQLHGNWPCDLEDIGDHLRNLRPMAGASWPEGFPEGVEEINALHLQRGRLEQQLGHELSRMAQPGSSTPPRSLQGEWVRLTAAAQQQVGSQACTIHWAAWLRPRQRGGPSCTFTYSYRISCEH